MNFFIVKL